MLETTEDAEGVSFGVRVTPRASANDISGVEGGRLKVRLNAPPVDGKANSALVKFLAKALGVSKGSVSLAQGEKSREKRLVVRGLSAAELTRRLGL